MIGAIAAAGISALGQWYANRQQRAFAENMANTSWSRGVADMRRAGLNPALAYSQGGASSPSISPGNIGSSAASAIQLRNQTKAVNAEVNLKRIQERLVWTQEQVAKQVRDKTSFEKRMAGKQLEVFEKTLKEQIEMVAAQLNEKTTIAEANSARTLKMGAETGKIESEAVLAQWLADFYDKGGGWADKLGVKDLLRMLIPILMKSNAN